MSLYYVFVQQMKKIDKNAVEYGMPIELMMKNDRHMSPKFQMKQGITLNQIECNNELQLMFKVMDRRRV